MNTITEQAFRRSLYRDALKSNLEIKHSLEQLFKGSMSGETVQSNESLILKSEKQKERLGQFIQSKTIVPPFDNGTPLNTLGVKTIDNLPSHFNAMMTEADINTLELNMSLIMGKWFDWNYNPMGWNATPVISNDAYCQLSKRIQINPFNRDVFVVAKTNGTLPAHSFSAVFDDWQPVEDQFSANKINIERAGARADFATSLSYIADGIHVITNRKSNKIINFIKTREDGDIDVTYNEQTEQICTIKLPAGTSELYYHTDLIGQAFTSSDINQYLQNNSINQYGLGMLDLRSETRHRNITMIYNPLSGDNWWPSGGLKLHIELDFYEVVILDTI
jgi:hypothetical protein